jgi:hypothetical protein
VQPTIADVGCARASAAATSVAERTGEVNAKMIWGADDHPVVASATATTGSGDSDAPSSICMRCPSAGSAIHEARGVLPNLGRPQAGAARAGASDVDHRRAVGLNVWWLRPTW